jgi:hypothetical protein
VEREALAVISQERAVKLPPLKQEPNQTIMACPYLSIFRRTGVLSRKNVDRVLGRLSELTGQDYSVETVGGYWIEKEG